MKLVFGNFKMNGRISKIYEYIDSINELPDEELQKICIFFPYTFFGYIDGARFKYGAQDCYYEDYGAHTGDISAAMLKECGCEYVIVGHSERRIGHEESNEIIDKKLRSAICNELKPVLCVGEKTSQRKQRFEVIREQLNILTPKNDEVDFSDLIIAYEPVWAIGSGRVPSITEVDEVAEFIAEHVIKLTGKKVPVLYGGSIKTTNAGKFLNIEKIDGILVGNSCLDAHNFKEIIKMAI